MKVRTDFITNSSSSSFIVGRKDEENVNIEYVYQLMRQYFKEFLEGRDRLLKAINDGKIGDLKYIEDEYWSHFEFKDKGRKSWKWQSMRSVKFKKKYGVDVWDYYKPDWYYGWIELETYAEYEKYWKDMMAIYNIGEGCDRHAPFTIIGYYEYKDVLWLHRGNGQNVEYYDIGLENDELGWYFPYITDGIDSNFKCEDCRCNGWCIKEDCAETYNAVDGGFDKEYACRDLLGRVCVCSESGYLPNYVVEKLKLVSRYSCNHMG